MQEDPLSRPVWKKHEDHVAALYRLLGYRVITDINVNGQQSDLLCTKWIPGAGDAVLYVDAKYTKVAGKSYVSKDIVDQFAATFHARKVAQGWTAGVLLSNRPFSQYAKAAAAPHRDIFLKTLQELYDDLFCLRPYLHSVIHAHEKARTFFDFVPLKCTGVTSFSRYGTDEEVGAQSLADYVDHWLIIPEYPQLCILGDFGSGKTTFLQHLHHRLATTYLERPDCRMPFFIRLRDYYNARDLPDLLDRFFSLELGAKVPWPICQDFLQSGRLLFLLDGFDEMGLASESAGRRDNYRKLAALLTENSKLIISCRPAYFPTGRELSAVFSYVYSQVSVIPSLSHGSTVSKATASIARLLSDRVHKDEERTPERKSPLFDDTLYVSLSLFDKGQVISYLQKHEATIAARSYGQLNSSMMYDRISEIYDLEDLAKRPMLLKLIVLTLPSFTQNVDGTYSVVVAGRAVRLKQVTPWNLYYVYTEEELSREYKKSVRWELERQLLRRIIATIAFTMLRDGVASLPLDALQSVIAGVIDPLAATNQQIISSVHTCSFLARDPDDRFRFTHKSFMEYYAAEYLVALVCHDNGTSNKPIQEVLAGMAYPDEVLYFLGYALSELPVIIDTISHELGGTDGTQPADNRAFQSNAINVLNHAGFPPSPLNGVDADFLSYQKTRSLEIAIESCAVGDLKVLRTRIARFAISESRIRRWFCTDCDPMELVLDSTTVEQAEISKTRISFQVRGSTITHLSLANSQASGSFSECVLALGSWGGSQATKLLFDGVLIMSNSDDHLLTRRRMHNVIFRQCIFINLEFRDGVPDGVIFEECVFINCYLSKRLGLANLRGSRGVFIFRENEVRERAELPVVRGDDSRPKVLSWEQFQDLRKGSKRLPRSWEERLAAKFPAERMQGKFWNLGEVRRALTDLDSPSHA